MNATTTAFGNTGNTGNTNNHESFGGFSLGGLHMALPLEALREVVPRGELMPVPCDTPGVVGGRELHGAIVPVIDLRVLLGRDATAPAGAVVVAAHEGHALGLLVESVDGVFRCAPEGIKRVAMAGDEDPLFSASLVRHDNRQQVALLSVGALTRVKGIPRVEDPAGRGLMDGTMGAAAAEGPARAWVLVRCHQLGLALDAQQVRGTLTGAPVIERSPLAVGHCLGVTRHGGRQLPVVDLMALCGHGRLQPTREPQALVLRLPQGEVALLVQEVLDVAHLPASALLPPPGSGLAVPELVAGVVPASALSSTSTSSAKPDHFLALDPAALQSHPLLLSLAEAMGQGPVLRDGGRPVRSADSSPMPTPSRGNARLAAPLTLDALEPTSEARPMLVFSIGRDLATPLEQVQEILAFSPVATGQHLDQHRMQDAAHRDDAAAQSHPAWRGMVVSRDRSIPVFSLCQLLAADPSACTEPSGASAVLVVASDAGWVGFAVDRLRAIEPARWEPPRPKLSHWESRSAAGVAPGNTLALIGQGAEERMLNVVNLDRLAQLLKTGSPAAA